MDKTVENQRVLYYNFTPVEMSEGHHWVAFQTEELFATFEELSYSQFKVLSYLMSLVPHTNNGQKNTKNTRSRPYSLSPVAIGKALNMHRDTARDAINALIEKGYIIHQKGNVYYFDNRPYDKRSKSIKEYEETKEIMSAEEVYKQIHTKQVQDFMNLSQEIIENNQNEEPIYDWMLEDEVKEIEKRNAARRTARRS